MGALASAACGPTPSVNDTGPDAGTGDGGGGGGGGNDAAVADGRTTPVIPRWPAVVLVDGLVSGSATDTTNQPIALGDVRVCVFDSNKNALTDYAKPDGAPMPLANYPGVHRGGGVDLGSFQVTGTITLDVFPADELSSDGAWVQDRSAYTCTNIACNGGLPCQRHVELTVAVGADVNVVGLVDGEPA